MRELLQQMGEVHFAAKAPARRSGLGDPRHRPRSGRHPARRDFPTEHFGVPLAGSLLPWIDTRPRQRPEPRGVEGPRRDQQDPRPRSDRRSPVDGLCVRVGAMRCHSQGLTHQAEEATSRSPRSSRSSRRATRGCKVVPNRRDETLKRLTPVAVTGTLDVPIGRLRKLQDGRGVRFGLYRGRPAALGRRRAAAAHARNPARRRGCLRAPRA